jgi:lipoprotein-releasing system permease protein
MSSGNGFEWFLARRYLASSGGNLLSFITWVALGGVIVGVTALIVVIGVMTGMQEDLRGKILESSPHVLVLQQGASLRLDNWPSVAEQVRAVDGVVAVAPWIMTQVSLVLGNYSQSADLFGVTLDPEGLPVTEMEAKIQDGMYSLADTESGLPPMIMGGNLAARMSVFVGDTIGVMALEGSMTIDPFTMGPSLRIREFEVTGTFKTGMYDYDIKNVYVRLEDSQDLLNIQPDVVGGLGVRTEDPDRAGEVASAIRDTLGLAYVPQSWTVTNQALFSALALEKLAMMLILFLIVVVAAFNIVGTLVMVVVDRTREIGILKSMGMRDRGILKVFMLQGIWIGVIGTVIGASLGVGIGWLIDTYDIIKIPAEVYFVDHLPVSIRAADVLVIVAGSIAIAFAATIYPALRASRLQPVDAIRHE